MLTTLQGRMHADDGGHAPLSDVATTCACAVVHMRHAHFVHVHGACTEVIRQATLSAAGHHLRTVISVPRTRVVFTGHRGPRATWNAFYLRVSCLGLDDDVQTSVCHWCEA